MSNPPDHPATEESQTIADDVRTLHRFGYAQQFTADDLCDRVASTSFVAAMSLVDRDELLVRVRALVHGLAEPFPFPYKTEVHLIPRSSDRDDFGRGTSIQG